MKIVLLGTTAGCVLGFRADLISALVAHGHKVYAFSLDYTEESKQKVKQLGAEPVDYTFSRTGLNPIGDMVDTFRLVRRFSQINPNVVLSYFSKPVIFGTIAATLAGVKCKIGMLEGLGYTFTEQPSGDSLKVKLIRRAQVLLYKLSLPLLQRVIFLNPDDPADLIEKYSIRKVRYSVLGGIGLKLKDYPYCKPPVEQPAFIFVGRLLAEKGVNEFVAAAKLVKSKYYNCRFIILGAMDKENPGGLDSDILHEVVEQGIVEYPGHVTNVVDWISSSSVFVLPSYREGVPRSTQEAMAVGRAVITTDVPGCRETVIDGVNGFLVPPWSPERLAEKMIFFIENPGQIEKMGLESFRLAHERFDADEVNSRLMQYIYDIAGVNKGIVGELYE